MDAAVNIFATKGINVKEQLILWTTKGSIKEVWFKDQKAAFKSYTKDDKEHLLKLLKLLHNLTNMTKDIEEEN